MIFLPQNADAAWDRVIVGDSLSRDHLDPRRARYGSAASLAAVRRR
jgi:hypothetical protein